MQAQDIEYAVSFGTPRGKLNVNTGHPGGFGFLGCGTLTFQAGDVLLTATKRLPVEWTFMTGLLCMPILLYFAYYSFHLNAPMGTLFTLPLSGLLLARTGTILLCGATVCNVILAGRRVQFTSRMSASGQQRTVYLQAANGGDAEAIRARLATIDDTDD
jgi:hypothetical protein